MNPATPITSDADATRKRRRIWAARGIAIAADAVQICAAPFFSEGFMSPVNAGLDVVVAICLILLVGWHIAFLPTFIVEQLPFADLAPTWTIGVLFVTRGSRPASAAATRVADLP